MKRLSLNKIILTIAVVLSFSAVGYFAGTTLFPKEVYTVFGSYDFDKDILEIVNSPVIQRLKKVDQSGPARYFGPMLPAFSRYDHSIGVFALLKKVGASLKEQIAGLLHDSSHTVFSHVGDYIFSKNINDYAKESYQDTVHIKHLKTKMISLEKLGIGLKDLDIGINDYKALEQDLPDMCADRIQYNIHTGQLLGLISQQEALEIANDLKFENGKWFFSNKDIAKKFANLSLYFTQNFWGAKWNTSMNIHLANALKRALKLKIITEKELFSTDDVVMKKLVKNQDHLIQLNLQQCKKPLETIPGKTYKKEFFKPKFRGINPLVKIANGELKRLTELDYMFRSQYEEIEKWCNNGFEIYILSEF